MSNRLSTLLVLGVSLASPPALTFEVATHAAFTQSAVDKARSVSDPSLFGLERLGILEINNLYQRDVFGSRFFDFVGGVVTERFADSPGFVPPGYEMNVFGFANLVPQFLTLGGWVVRGAIREDDVYWDFRSKNPRNNPQDDLCTQNVQPCYRVLNHFFDPYNNRPLSVEAPLIGEIRLPVERSPDWAIGAVDSFASNAQQNPARSNHFSIFDAREAMYRALTLKKTNPFAPGYVDIYSPGSGTAAEKAAARAAYWATTFFAVGTVMHHVQDMAQPQHTRSEPHAGEDYESGGAFGHKSFFEQYVDDRVSRRRFFAPDGRGFDTDPLAFDGYPIPTFNSYADYWSTARGPDRRPGSLAGKGLADYSSRGFYSAGTNVGSVAGQQYAEPPNSPGLVTTVTRGAPLDMAGNALPGSIDFVVGEVRDVAVPAQSKSGALLSSHGVFDQFLVATGRPAAFNLNKYNYDEQADLLVRRAVSYSAGLIDYFFRGKLKLNLPPENVYAVEDFSNFAEPNAGFKKLKVMVMNDTPAISPPEESTSYAQSTSVEGGTLVAVLRYRLNGCINPLDPTLDGAPRFNPNEPAVPIWDESCRQPPMRPNSPAGRLPAGTAQPLPNIVASNPAAIPPEGIDGAPRQVVFEFPQALPFNATDVDLQVIYRGPLGTETDGIAVGFEALSEPTFFNFDNFLDCNGPCTAGATSDGCTMTAFASLPFNRGGLAVAGVDKMPAGRYARVAFLTHAGLNSPPDLGEALWPMTNQDFGASVPVRGPTGEIVDTWPAGVKLLEPMFESRRLVNRGPMLSWLSSTVNSLCDRSCYYAQVRSCPTPAMAEPFPALIHF